MAEIKIKQIRKTPMSKKSKIMVLIFLGIIYLCLVVGICVSNYGKSVADVSVNTFCYDEMSAFSGEQVGEINAKCKYVQETYGVDVYVATCLRIAGGFASKNGTDFLVEHGIDYDSDLIVLIINMNTSGTSTYNYHFDIYTYGSCYTKLTENEIDHLLFSKAGDDILEGGEKAFDGTIQMVENLGKAYKFIFSDSYTGILIVCSIIAIIAAFIIIEIIKGKYRKDRFVENYAFDTNSKLDLELNTDTFLRKSVTYVHINTDSGSGGGGFSGGGGGFGHRGGR